MKYQKIKKRSCIQYVLLRNTSKRKRVIIFGVKKSQKSNISLFYENLRNKEKLEQEPLKNYLKGLPKFRPVSFNENLYI